jgi:CPA2 family monovalent cation:H+ antiporter-2
MAGTLLLEVGVMFAAIAAVSFLTSWVGLSPIPFYIGVGMLVNEFVVGRVGLPYVTESSFVTVGAELGIVFLLFFLGLEFNLDRLVADRAHIGKAGVLDFGVNFGVGFLLGYLFFGATIPAVLVAGIVYISSSAVITKTLLDLGWIANPESTPMLGTLVFEDLVVAIYLAVVSAVVLGEGGFGVAARSIGVALGFILLLVALVYFGTALLERMLQTSSTEYFILRTIGVTVLLAGAALAVGVSEAVAAFFVGMAFSSTSVVHDIEAALSPLRDTFAAVFFFWIGLITDPLTLLGVTGLLAVAVVTTAPSKLVSGFLGGRIYGLDSRRSVRVGLGMVTRGEFSLIIGSVALAGAGATLTEATAGTIYAFAVGYVLVMSILGTVLMQSAPVVESFVARE